MLEKESCNYLISLVDQGGRILYIGVDQGGQVVWEWGGGHHRRTV